MKQHITTEQLNELSEKADTKLRKWGVEHTSCWMFSADRTTPNIGDMIEFLLDRSTGSWFVNHDIGNAVSEDMCDTLWEYTKEVLEK